MARAANLEKLIEKRDALKTKLREIEKKIAEAEAAERAAQARALEGLLKKKGLSFDELVKMIEDRPSESESVGI